MGMKHRAAGKKQLWCSFFKKQVNLYCHLEENVKNWSSGKLCKVAVQKHGYKSLLFHSYFNHFPSNRKGFNYWCNYPLLHISPHRVCRRAGKYHQFAHQQPLQLAAKIFCLPAQVIFQPLYIRWKENRFPHFVKSICILLN